MGQVSVNRLSETIVICNTEYIHFDLVNNMGMIDWYVGAKYIYYFLTLLQAVSSNNRLDPCYSCTR